MRPSANIHTSDRNSKRPLAFAASAKKDEPLNVRYLLRLKADIDARDTGGYTALMWAASQGHEKCSRALIVHNTDDKKAPGTEKCDVCAQNSSGGTALMIAVNGGHQEVVRLLLQKSTKSQKMLTTKNEDGWTAFLIAARQGESIIMKDIHWYMQRHENADVIDRIIRGKNKEGHDALACAVYSGKPPAVQTLINQCNYPFDNNSLTKKDIREVVKYARGLHDQLMFQLLTSYVDIPADF